MSVLWWVGVFLAGGLGAVLRLEVDTAVTRRTTGDFPVGTLVVNLTGAVVLGVLAGLVLPQHVALVVGTGIVGSYTTFSTWMFESHRLLEERRNRLAMANLAVSLVAGLAVAALGAWIGGMVR